MPSDPHRIAVRMNGLFLSRATEQSAILAALMPGRTEKSRPTLEKVAASSLLGYLQDGYFFGRIKGAEGAITVNHIGQKTENECPPNLKLDFYLDGIDGTKQLADGLANGAASILVGGEENSLRQLNVQGESDYYLVILLRASEYPFAIDSNDVCGPNPATLESVLENLKLIQRVVIHVKTTARAAKSDPALAVLGHKESKPIRNQIAHQVRTFQFAGSSVAAALGAVLEPAQYQGFLAVVRTTHAGMIAAAARATEGAQFVAFPVTVSNGSAMVKENTKIVSGDHFIKSDDIFMLMTAATDCSILLPGVRFLADNIAVTTTIALQAHTKSVRRIESTHHLEKRSFYLYSDGQSKRSTYAKLRDEYLSDELGILPREPGVESR